MVLNKIIRAWKDPEFRADLSEEELAELPQNPAGAIELTDDELDLAAGGSWHHHSHPSHSYPSHSHPSHSGIPPWRRRPSFTWRQKPSNSYYNSRPYYSNSNSYMYR